MLKFNQILARAVREAAALTLAFEIERELAAGCEIEAGALYFDARAMLAQTR